MTTAAALKERLRTRAVAMYKAGEATDKIATWAGVHPSTVLAWAKKAGANRPPSTTHTNHDENVRAAVLADLREYKPLRWVAKKHGVPVETVARWRRAAGLATRSDALRARFDRELAADPSATAKELAVRVGASESTVRRWHKEADALPEDERAYRGGWIKRGVILVPARPRSSEAA